MMVLACKYNGVEKFLYPQNIVMLYMMSYGDNGVNIPAMVFVV